MKKCACGCGTEMPEGYDFILKSKDLTDELRKEFYGVYSYKPKIEKELVREALNKEIIRLLNIHTILSTKDFYELGLDYFDYFKKGDMYTYLKKLQKKGNLEYVKYSRSTGVWKLR